MYKSLIIMLLCFLPVLLAAQSSQSYLDAKCQELAESEARSEAAFAEAEAKRKAEAKRIATEKARLNASKMELTVQLYSKQLVDLRLQKAKEMAELEAKYLRLEGEIQQKMQVTTILSNNPSCAQ
jgi:hypothetical protein